MAPLEKLLLHFAGFLLALVLSGSKPILQKSPGAPTIESVVPIEVDQVAVACQKKVDTCKFPPPPECRALEDTKSCLKAIIDCEMLTDTKLNAVENTLRSLRCGIYNVTITDEDSKIIENDNLATVSPRTPRVSLNCSEGIKVCEMKRKLDKDKCRAEVHFRMCLDFIEGCVGKAAHEVDPYKAASLERESQSNCHGHAYSKGKEGSGCGVAASLPTVLVALMVTLFCQHRLSGGGG